MDFGSGKGFFSELLIDKVKEIHLAETSKNCIEICKNKFSNYDHISYHLLSPENYLLVSSNFWDITGGGWYGFKTFWVNRYKFPKERLNYTPTNTGNNLMDLVTYLENVIN